MVKTVEQLRSEQQRNSTHVTGVVLSLYECRLMYEGFYSKPLPGDLPYDDAARLVWGAMGEVNFNERLEEYRVIIADGNGEALEQTPDFNSAHRTWDPRSPIAEEAVETLEEERSRLDGLLGYGERNHP